MMALLPMLSMVVTQDRVAAPSTCTVQAPHSAAPQPNFVPVMPTLDGEAYYQRCVNLIADMEDAEGAFVGAKPSGLIRVDAHGTQARYFLLPGLPRFLRQYPDIRLHLSEIHQPLDMIREGFDCILRAGELSDSPLIKRRLATLDRGTFASPDYLSRYGTPRTPDNLVSYDRDGLLSPDTDGITPLSFCAG